MEDMCLKMKAGAMELFELVQVVNNTRTEVVCQGPRHLHPSFGTDG